MMNKNILIVDDEKYQREILISILKDEGYYTESAKNANEALTYIKNSFFPLVLLDLKLPDFDGVELLKKILNENPLTVIIIMTAYGSIDSAVEAMKLGAFDYLQKPIERDKLLITVKRAFEKLNLLMENRSLRQQLEDKFRFDNIIGSHGKMQEIFRIVKKVALSNSTILIYGESGTGKELIAKAIHYNSSRKDMPFYAINCAAIPETLLEAELFGYEKGAFTGAISRKIGIIESSNNGTFFLDEIGEMSTNMQAKLLRVIQDKEIRRLGGREDIKIDVRIISATNKNIEKELSSGRFREDLYYRLNVVSFLMPPLRERITDVPELVEHFINKYNIILDKNTKSIDADALGLLMKYYWPGNVRQLESVIERAILLSERNKIGIDDLPIEIKIGLNKSGEIDFEIPDNGLLLKNFEREIILKAMIKSDWIIAKAAKLLGISYRTLQYRLNKLGIKRE